MNSNFTFWSLLLWAFFVFLEYSLVQAGSKTVVCNIFQAFGVSMTYKGEIAGGIICFLARVVYGFVPMLVLLVIMSAQFIVSTWILQRLIRKNI